MAIIKSGNSTDQWTIDPTNAGRVTLYDANGNLLYPLATRRSVANILVRQSAATVAGAVVWAMRNPYSNIIVSIMRIYLQLSFDGIGAATLMRYELIKGTGCTAMSGGAIVIPLIKRTSIGQSNTDIHVLDTGLTLTGVTFGSAFHTVTWGRNTPSASIQAASSQHKLNYFTYPIELAMNEVLAIRNGPTNNSVIGDTILGSVDFVEG